MPIAIEELRREVEREHIGFSPATTSVKPVHIANGLFRVILGDKMTRKVAQTNTLFQFVISQSAKGEIPDGHELEKVYTKLSADKRLDADVIRVDDVSRLRVLMKKVVGADSAVFAEKGMESYTAGFSGFVSKDRIAQDGGELVAAWLQKRKSPLCECLIKALTDPGDVITVLSLPLLEDGLESYASKKASDEIDFDRVRFLNKPPSPELRKLWSGLGDAAVTLSEHLDGHPNKLFRLRLGVLFAAFVLIRHLSSLEASSLPGATVPVFLLDFSEGGLQPVARASLMTYMRTCQSIARFYAWAFGENLRKLYSFSELRREPVPTYKRRDVKPEMKEIWEVALQESGKSKQPFIVLGQAIYDMMAMEAEANPIGYLRRLGLLIGLLYPPNQSAQRFAVKQDLLEMLLRGAIRSGETVSMSDLQERFWERYGILVGGRPADEQALIRSGIYQVDSNALQDNRAGLADTLSRLNFARLLADGVLQVEAEATNVG